MNLTFRGVNIDLGYGSLEWKKAAINLRQNTRAVQKNCLQSLFYGLDAVWMSNVSLGGIQIPALNEFLLYGQFPANHPKMSKFGHI